MNTDLAHSPPLEQPPAPAPSPVSPPRRFALFPTILAALVLAGGFLVLANLVSSTPPLERVAEQDRDRALALVVNRTMDLEYAVAQTQPWEHVLYDATTGWMDELAQAVAWYEELADASNEPLTLAYLAVLEGESGRLAKVQDEIKGWDQLPDPFPTYAGLLREAYLSQAPLDGGRARALREDLADVVPAGWFADRLAVSLATRAGDRVWLSEAQGNLATRARDLLWRARVMLVIDVGMMLLGIALAVLLARHVSAAALTVGGAAVPPPWPGSVGAVVLIRGGALWIASMVAVLSLGSTVVRVLAVPLTYLPLLALARRHLLGPAGLGLQDGLGFVPVPSGWSRCWRLVGIAAGAGLLGEWLLTLVAEPLGLSSHWTEGFDDAMIWGDLPDLAASLVETIVFAPLFEEVVFRGLFFSTLRRRFGFVASALISASVFAIAHGYGVLGFASVLWSGVIWAWVYERSGSVLPGILAHMANNAVVCLSVLLFLR